MMIYISRFAREAMMSDFRGRGRFSLLLFHLGSYIFSFMIAKIIVQLCQEFYFHYIDGLLVEGLLVVNHLILLFQFAQTVG